jgi:glycine/D-amino acid oxidase-like deaminating enzyme
MAPTRRQRRAPSRRELLRAAAAGGALWAVGCAPVPRPLVTLPRLRVTPMRVGPEREIRTVVGLRPFRPGGFVVRAEKLDDKLIVHNYGHGGGGVTLSWGTADQAVRLALQATPRRVAVLGCGAVGLASARLLQERGADVVIYAAALPPETTSNIAGAQWFPSWPCEPEAMVPPFRDQLVEAARFAYRRFQLLVGAEYGVRWMTNYYLGNHPPREEGFFGQQSLFRALMPAYEELLPGRHPFPVPSVRRFETMMIEPSVYLPAMLRDVRLAGGSIVVRRLADRAEVATLPEPVVVNCTGLGARELFGDEELTPLKGQLTVLLPQPEIDYAILYGDLYSFARRDGLLLGGTHEEGDWSLDPDLAAKERIVAGHARLHAALAARA